MGLFSNKEIDLRYIKRLILFLLIMIPVTMVLFFPAALILIIALIVWLYRYRQYKRMEK
jgi:hypothetical protein